MSRFSNWRSTLVFVSLVAIGVAAGAASAAPRYDYLELIGSSTAGSVAPDWVFQGPLDLPGFTLTQAKVVVTFRNLATSAIVRAVPVTSVPLASQQQIMTMDRTTAAFVQFRDLRLLPGTYAVRSDARTALVWKSEPPPIDLVTPTTYLYVSPVRFDRKPDAEIAALAKIFVTGRASVIRPFTSSCGFSGGFIGSAGMPVTHVRFLRAGKEQTGSGTTGIHATAFAATDDAGASGAFSALNAIDVAFVPPVTAFASSATPEPVSNDSPAPAPVPSPAVCTSPFASAADVARYLRASN